MWGIEIDRTPCQIVAKLLGQYMLSAVKVLRWKAPNPIKSTLGI